MDASGKRASKIFAIVGIVGALALCAIVRRAHHEWEAIGGPVEAQLEERRVHVLELPSMAFSGGLRAASWDLAAGRAELAAARAAAAEEPVPDAPATRGLDVGGIDR